MRNHIQAGNSARGLMFGVASSAPAHTTTHRIRTVLGVGAVVVVAVTVRVVSSAPSAHPSPTAASHTEALGSNRGGALGAADGVVPDGVTVFDDNYPAVAKLDPSLLSALRRAAGDASRDGVQFFVDSGWRSRKYQEQLLDEAIAKYGSKAEAARWVASPETSAHVSGEAVDIGHSAAVAWLSHRGAAYGLCQIYSNEPWHYELRLGAIEHGCPRMYADATHGQAMPR